MPLAITKSATATFVRLATPEVENLQIRSSHEGHADSPFGSDHAD